jgi:LacI family transcriptional regulator
MKKKIGLIIPDGTNQYFSSIAQSFQKEYTKQGIAIIVVDSNNNKSHEISNIKLLSDMDISGLIFISVGDSGKAFETLSTIKIPLLVIDREIPLENADFLINHDSLGIRIGLEYLYNLNHRKIAFIKGHQETSPGRERYRSFRETCAELNLEVEERLIFDGDFMFGSGNYAADQISNFNNDIKPTAIFASNDVMALGILQKLQENGFVIPKDFSILGYDDIQLSSWVFPKLTTIRQDVMEFATQGVELLNYRIENPASSSKVKIIKPQLIERDSCIRI